MDKKTILLSLLLVGVVVLGIVAVNLLWKKESLSSPLSNTLPALKQVSSSKTLKTHTDPSGFSFNYPDNLSLVNNEPKTSNTYASLELISNEVDGKLRVEISDTKFPSLDEWVKVNKGNSTPKEIKLRALKAFEIITEDKLLLGSIDQKVLFTIEVNFGQNKDFWGEVYSKVLADFSFVSPSQDSASSGTSDITFEGEEVVE